MKNKIILFLLAMPLFLSACSQPNEQEFNEYASKLYMQMFTDGEQSDKVKSLYAEIKQYGAFKNEHLYVSLVNMYESLENDPVNSAKYQVEVMNILNTQ